MAMRLSTALSRAHKLLNVAVEFCVEKGIEPLLWQDQEFGAQSEGYRTSEEQSMIDRTPRITIRTWLDGLPDSATGLAGSNPIMQPRQNPGRYAGEHPIQYPDYEPRGKDWHRDLKPFDSHSCADVEVFPEVKSARRTKQMQVEEPPSWTWNKEVKERLAENHPRVLQRHFH